MVFEANEATQRNKSLRVEICSSLSKSLLIFPPFQAVDQWHYVIAEQLAANAVPMLLLANKNDNGKLAIGAEVLDEVSDESRPRLC